MLLFTTTAINHSKTDRTTKEQKTTTAHMQLITKFLWELFENINETNNGIDKPTY